MALGEFENTCTHIAHVLTSFSLSLKVSLAKVTEWALLSPIFSGSMSPFMSQLTSLGWRESWHQTWSNSTSLCYSLATALSAKMNEKSISLLVQQSCELQVQRCGNWLENRHMSLQTTLSLIIINHKYFSQKCCGFIFLPHVLPSTVTWMNHHREEA